MAVVTWPLSSGEARGRVGGLIYNTWRGRSYVKAYTLPATLFSPAQVDARANTTACTVQWHAISDQQRDAWTHFADTHLLPNWTGQPLRISGYNWFIRLNWYPSFYWGTIWDDPPAEPASQIFTGLTVYYVAPDLFIEWTPQTTGPPYPWIIEYWLEGPYAHPRKPSIKRAVRTDGYPDPYASMTNSLLTAGFYNVHVRAISDHGFRMPFTPFSVEVT